MKKILVLAVCLIYQFSYAQLPPNSFGEDFTLTDINGNEFNLYSHLDSGKTVILDMFATWCGPCWNFAETGVLEQLQEEYPNDVVVVSLEADSSTPESDIYGGGNAVGDWTNILGDIIIDDPTGNVANDYALAYYPTIYKICPDRMVTELGQLGSVDAFMAEINQCNSVDDMQQYDLKLISYTGDTYSCNGELNASVRIQNYGYSDIQEDNTAEGQLVIKTFNAEEGDVYSETWLTIEELSSFQVLDVDLGNISDIPSTYIGFEIGWEYDENQDNNTLYPEIIGAVNTSQDIFLYLMTDEWGYETSWELLNSDGEPIYSGGGYDSYWEVNDSWNLSPGCYVFNLYDEYGDGLMASQWGAEYSDGIVILSDVNSVIWSGSDFGSEISIPFQVMEETNACTDIFGQWEYITEDIYSGYWASNLPNMRLDMNEEGAQFLITNWYDDDGNFLDPPCFLMVEMEYYENANGMCELSWLGQAVAEVWVEEEEYLVFDDSFGMMSGIFSQESWQADNFNMEDFANNTCVVGCLDSEADNYNENADLSDESCIYGQYEGIALNDSLSNAGYIFLEDFSNVNDNAYITYNDMSQGGWMWSTESPQGMWSDNAGIIESETPENGFMILDADFFNSSPFNGLSEGEMTQDIIQSSFDIGPIDLSIGNTGELILQFYSNYRICCYYPGNGNNDLNIYISTDGGVTFEDLNYIEGDIYEVNEEKETFSQISLSDFNANASNVYFRFEWIGSHYYWMIDDMSVMIQPEYDLEINTASLTTNIPYGVQYYSIPQNQLPEQMKISAEVHNFGSNDDYNAVLIGNVSDMNGGIDMAIDTFSILSGETITVEGSDFYINPNFMGIPISILPPNLYEFTANIESSGQDPTPQNNSFSREFSVSENIYALDGLWESYDVIGTGSPWGNVPTNYMDYTDGIGYANLFNFKQDAVLSSVGVFLYTDELNTYNAGVFTSEAGGEVIVSVYGPFYEEDVVEDWGSGPEYNLDWNSGTLGFNYVAESDFYQITQEDIDNGFMTIDMPEVYLNEGSYYVAIHLYSNGFDSPILLWDDTSVEQPYWASLYYDPMDNWWYTDPHAASIQLGLDGLEIQFGCMDETAINYNEEANLTDYACYYLEGCTDETACNYNEEADFDDGSCDYESCIGCMDEYADNYSSEFTISNPFDCVYEGSSNTSCIWESDFSDASDWVTAHDQDDCSLDWEIGYNLECGGYYPIEPIVSENGYYAMVDSDEYGGEEGGADVEDSWLTTANPINISEFENIIVEFDTWYRSWTYEKCFLVVSTDGEFPTNLTPDSSEDPANGIYEIFPDISGNGGATIDTNPYQKRINISESINGEEQIWIRFNWTGTWGYSWFIDNVCVKEQPAIDLVLESTSISQHGTDEQYGRVPQGQIGGSNNSYNPYIGASVFNFGTNDVFNANVLYQTSVNGSIQNTSTLANFNISSGETIYSQENINFSNEIGLHEFSFMINAEGDMTPSNNTETRKYQITNNNGGLYSLDGIGVYDDPDISRMGTGSFTDANDGFMMMTYYHLTSDDPVYGIEILLDSYHYENYLSTSGGEIVVALKDFFGVYEGNDPYSDYIQSDFYYITEDDINNGKIFVPFYEPWYGSGQFYASVEMYSNGNDSPIYILDDETYEQLPNSSMIYIPGDDVYTNSNAPAIRLVMGSGPPAEGCTDPAACNYDPDAGLDDGSCEYLESGEDCIAGCMDMSACNYDEMANFSDDSSCEYPNECTGSCEDEVLMEEYISLDDYWTDDCVDDEVYIDLSEYAGSEITLDFTFSFTPSGNHNGEAWGTIENMSLNNDGYSPYNYQNNIDYSIPDLGGDIWTYTQGYDYLQVESMDYNWNDYMYIWLGENWDGIEYSMYSGGEFTEETTMTYSINLDLSFDNPFNSFSFYYDMCAYGYSFETSFSVEISECTPYVAGCMDEMGCDYNPEAQIPEECDYSCLYGCMNEQACNYDPNVLYEDGSCEFSECGVFEVYGCTDESACNYDFYSNVDNGTCGLLDDCGACRLPFCFDFASNNTFFITEEECNNNYLGLWFSNDCEESAFCISSDADPFWNSDCPPELISITPNTSPADETLTVTISGNYIDFSEDNFYFVQWSNVDFSQWSELDQFFDNVNTGFPYGDSYGYNGGYEPWTDTGNGDEDCFDDEILVSMIYGEGDCMTTIEMLANQEVPLSVVCEEYDIGSELIGIPIMVSEICGCSCEEINSDTGSGYGYGYGGSFDQFSDSGGFGQWSNITGIIDYFGGINDFLGIVVDNWFYGTPNLPLVSGDDQLDGTVSIDFDQELGLYDLFVFDESSNEWLVLGDAFEVTEPILIPGCLDQSACNFNPNANISDNSCGLVDECGTCHTPFCYDPFSSEALYVDAEDCNYIWLDADCENSFWCLADETFNIYWNECDFSEVFGCTDPLACNYDNTATSDNGLCWYAEEYYNCNNDCNNDTDEDNICDEIDDCIGQYDLCGVCNGDGASCDTNPWDENTFITDCNATLAVGVGETILIDENPITIGDWIGVFYTDLNGELVAGGSGMWTGEPMSITIWGDDTSTSDVKEGFSSGEAYTWMIWDSETDQYITNIDIEYIIGSEYFYCNDLLNLASITAYSTVLQQIPLPMGWFMMSTYIDTDEFTIEDVLNPIQENLIIVKDYMGNVYWPTFGINSIGNISKGSGYQIKMITADTLGIEGNLIPSDYPIGIQQGWSFLGYLHQEPADIETMMYPVVDNIVILKNYAGEVYWPEFGLNSIGDMTPGWGYYIKTDNPVNVIYPDIEDGRMGFDLDRFVSNKYEKPINTGNNMVVAIPENVWEAKPIIGDEIVVYDNNGMIVGNAPYREEGTIITVWGDDELTSEKDGLKLGEVLDISLFRHNESVEEKINIISWTEGVGYYTINGISIAGSITQEVVKERKLLYVTDVVGRIVRPDAQQPVLLYIYDDGSVEKRYLTK